MNIFKDIVEFVFSFGLFINALLFIPQAIKIFRGKTAAGLSFITFLGFLLIQITIVLHGLINKDYLLVYGYLGSIFTCGSVLILAIVYKKNKVLEIDFGLEEVIEQLPGHIYWKNKDGVCLGCNKENWKDFGLKSLSDFVGKTDYDLFPKEQADKLRYSDKEVMYLEQPKILEEEVTNFTGKKALYLSHKLPLRNKKGEVIGILGVSLDITDAKKQSIERLQMLENIIALMPGHVYWINKEGVYLGCNDAQAFSAGLSSKKEIVGKRNKDLPWNINSGNLPDILDENNRKVMETGQAIVVEEPGHLSDGTEAVFLSKKVPMYNTDGEIVGMIGVSFDITDRKKNEQLLIAKEAAEAANKAKTQFLYNMKHDLRTPFSGILGIAEFMEKKETDPEKKENLSYITQSAKVLLDHLNEIFEFIHLESGELSVLEKQFDLHKALSDVFNMMGPSAREKSLPFTSERSEDLPKFVIGDRVRIQRILMNLVSNAIKFTDKGYVKLSASVAKRDDSKVIIKFVIEDTGVGIPEDKRDLIFEPFNRLTATYSGVYPGKGLGLRIVKHFLDEIGGEAHLESETGKGSIFKVLVPYKLTLLDCPEEQL